MISNSKVPAYKTLSQRFGERIKTIRESKGRTQLQIAMEVNMNRGFLSEVERGHKEMTLHKMHELATYFDMTLSDLLKGI